MSGRHLIVGTRGSRLALEQARRVREFLPGPSKVRIIQPAALAPGPEHRSTRPWS